MSEEFPRLILGDWMKKCEICGEVYSEHKLLQREFKFNYGGKDIKYNAEICKACAHDGHNVVSKIALKLFYK